MQTNVLDATPSHHAQGGGERVTGIRVMFLDFEKASLLYFPRYLVVSAGDCYYFLVHDNQRQSEKKQ
jgi:hypothetical protein